MDLSYGNVLWFEIREIHVAEWNCRELANGAKMLCYATYLIPSEDY